MTLTEIGTRIRSTRKARGMTQRALAERAGVSRYTIVKLETGRAGDIQFKVLSAILSELQLVIVVTEAPVSGIAVLGEQTP